MYHTSYLPPSAPWWLRDMWQDDVSFKMCCHILSQFLSSTVCVSSWLLARCVTETEERKKYQDQLLTLSFLGTDHFKIDSWLWRFWTSRSSLNDFTLALRLIRLSLLFFVGGRTNSLLSSSQCHPRYVTFNGGSPRTFLSTTLASLMSSMSSYRNGGAGSPAFLEQHFELGSLHPSVQKISPLLPNNRRHPNALQQVDFLTGPVNCL